MKKIINRTCNGNCSRCGDCCGLFVPLTEEEVNIVRQYVKKHNIKPTNRFNPLLNQFKATCCFYNEVEKKCNIYEARPYVCSHFICNDKDWLKHRDEYEKRAKYNSSFGQTTLASFDDLIYNDPSIILKYVLELVREKDGVDSKKLVNMLKYINRLDLLEFFECYDENGNKISGKDLLTID